MRNTGWYIPYWRKPKKKGKGDKAGAGSGEIVRSDEQLETVRLRWVERHRRTIRSLATLGLSMGSNRSEVQARFDRLRASGANPGRTVEDAYRYLMRVLPPVERRRKRLQRDGTTEMAVRAMVSSIEVDETMITADGETVAPIDADYDVSELDGSIGLDDDDDDAGEDGLDEDEDGLGRANLYDGEEMAVPGTAIEDSADDREGGAS